MADQGIWWKLWASALDDPDLDNLDVADFGRYCKLGALTKRHGVAGTLTIPAPARTLCAAFQVPDYDALECAIKRLPHVTCDAVTGVTSLTVTFCNWAKYQGDNSAWRVRKFREVKRSRREEKRIEENQKRSTPLSTSTTSPHTEAISPADKTFLDQCPDPYRSAWLDSEWWLSLKDGYAKVNAPVEASKYLSHQLGKPEHQRHRNVRQGLRNWFATADRWRQREEDRRAVQRSR